VKKIGKAAIFILIIIVFAVMLCFAETSSIENAVTLSYDFGEECADTACTVIVYAPDKNAESLANISGNFKDVLVFKKQVKTDKDGVYNETFKIDYENAVSGMYTAVIAGEDIYKSEKFLYINKQKTADAADLIDEKRASSADVADILKVSQFDLGVDDKFFDYSLADASAVLLCEYLESSGTDLSAENSEREAEIISIANKAVAIAAMNAGKISNIIENPEIFGLDSSSIKDFYAQDYVIDSVGTDMTQRVKAKMPSTFAEFDEALTEGFVLAVVKNPNGSENTKAVMQHFYKKIGVTQNGTTSQYDYVSNNNYESYEKLKKAFENAPKTQGGNGGGTGGGAGGGKPAVNTGNVSDLVYSDTTEKNEFKEYPIKIFYDLESVSWAEDAILYLAEKQIINGKGNYKFAPNDEITREEFLKIILNAFELTSSNTAKTTFKDVADNAWYKPFVETAYTLGIVNGHSEVLFGVGEKITREDMAVITERAAKLAEVTFTETESIDVFVDDNTISDYAKESVYHLKNAGIINGVGEGFFAPKQNATRAQAALMIYNVISK